MGLPDSVPEVADTVFGPADGPKVKVAEASPEVFVVTLVALSDPPPPVTAKITPTPDTGLPPLSVTFTTNGLGNACPTEPVWLFPLSCSKVVGVELIVFPVALKAIGLPASVPENAV